MKNATIDGHTTLSIGILAVLVIVLLSLMILLYLDRQFQSTIPCQAGECIVNIYSGIKYCQEVNSGAVMHINPSIEVCSPRYSCPSEVRYAVNSDGSASQSECEEGVECNCSSTVTCANYIQSYFKTSSNPYSNSDYYITQQSGYIDVLGNFNYNLPMRVTGYDEYCAVQGSLLDKIYPSTCEVGVLAYIPDNPSVFVVDRDLDNTPVACVRGKRREGLIAYWDKGAGRVLYL